MNHASSIMDRIPLAEYPIQNVRGAQQNKQLYCNVYENRVKHCSHYSHLPTILRSGTATPDAISLNRLKLHLSLNMTTILFHILDKYEQW